MVAGAIVRGHGIRLTFRCDVRYNKGVKSEPKHLQSERTVVAYTAGSQSEALVVRGLLESAGISVPGPVSPDPYPLTDANMSRGTTHGVAVYVHESQLDEARDIIQDYLDRDEQADEGEGQS